jgi:hypothetical protein
MGCIRIPRPETVTERGQGVCWGYTEVTGGSRSDVYINKRVGSLRMDVTMLIRRAEKTMEGLESSVDDRE